MARLVVVSNRVALPQDSSARAGGLAVAVLAALRQRGGLWFGWSGDVVADEAADTHVIEEGNVTYATVDLTRQDHDEYYNGYANRTLWPLMHYRLDLLAYSRRTLTGYLRVNRLFAERLAPLLRPDDLIWVHDYHLIPLAEQLREAGCRNRIGFFLHIPWPAIEVLLALPNNRNIVRAMCAYDLLGFQTEDHAYNFIEYATREAGGEMVGEKRVRAYDRTFEVEDFPIGIDTREMVALGAESEASEETRRLVDSLEGRKLVIGVDRLDYSKGLVQRVDAFEQLIADDPSLHGNVVMLQVTPPSRAEISEYVAIRNEVIARAGQTNARFSDYDWTPIRFLNRGFDRSTLAGFYRASRVGFITPLRDGMNLVAKEYVAAQSPEDPGVLILSRFAGAARELTGALIVNPYNTEGMADALRKALDMPLEERQARWSGMRDWLLQHDIAAWHESYVDALRQE